MRKVEWSQMTHQTTTGKTQFSFSSIHVIIYSFCGGCLLLIRVQYEQAVEKTRKNNVTGAMLMPDHLLVF